MFDCMSMNFETEILTSKPQNNNFLKKKSMDKPKAIPPQIKIWFSAISALMERISGVSTRSYSVTKTHTHIDR